MNTKTWIILTLVAVGLAGCSQSQEPAPNESDDGSTAAMDHMLRDEPLDGAVGVAEAHRAAAEGQPITMRGLVGGIAMPLAQERAVVTMIDTSVPKTCGTDPSGHCKTPWDYCCMPMENRKDSMASVQVLGPDGKVLKTSLAGLGGIQPFSEIAVHGTVRSVEPGERLIIDADAIHVISKAPPAGGDHGQCGH